jgi:hypothetical protein
MAQVDLSGFGYRESVDNAASTLTLTASDHSAYVVNTTVTSTITLPATAIGMVFILRVGAPGITLTISPNASDLIAGPGTANSGAGADNKDIVFTNQPAGSYVVLEAIPTTGFRISGFLGTFTVEG